GAPEGCGVDAGVKSGLGCSCFPTHDFVMDGAPESSGVDAAVTILHDNPLTIEKQVLRSAYPTDEERPRGPKLLRSG
ncbi:MAG: hypothetical protein WB561_07870, partial [Terracidiphilus sp.]